MKLVAEEAKRVSENGCYPEEIRSESFAPFSPNLSNILTIVQEDNLQTTMIKQRKLLDNQKISVGYLDYPVKLMAKYVGQTKAQLHQEF